MNTKRVMVISLLAFSALSTTVWAQDKEEPIAAERPGFTNGTDTVPMRHLQLETGYTFSHDGRSREHTLGDGMQLRIPVRSNFEARIGLPAYSWMRGDSHTEGLGDSSLSLKYRFQEDSPKRNALPALALIGGVELPTGKRDFREDDYQPTLALEADWSLTDALGLTADTVYNGIRQNGARYDEWAGGISLNLTLSSQWETFAELYRISDTGSGDTHANYFDTGVQYRIGANTIFDVNGGCGVFGTHANWFIGGGIARRW